MCHGKREEGLRNTREVGVKSEKGVGPGWETVSVSGQLRCVLGKFQ